MNMKKSIAGVMAGAMAVSAMAAVVSADEGAISLTYDLKTYVIDNNKTKAKVTVVANYEGSLITNRSWTADDVYGEVEVKQADGSYKKENRLIKGENTGYVTFGANNGFVTGGDIYTTKGVKIGSAKAADADMKEFEFTARPYKDIPNNIEEKYQTFKATSKADNIDGAYYDKNLKGASYNMPIAIGNDVYGAFDLSKYDLFALGYSVKENAEAAGLNTVTKTTYAVRDAVAKMTYEIPNTIQLNKATGWGWDYTYTLGNFTEAEMEHIFHDYFNSTLYGDVTMSAENFAKGFWNEKGEKKGLIKPDTALASDPTTVAIGAFTAGAAEEAKFPFKTTLNPSLRTDKVPSAYVTKTGNNENDVVAALTSRKIGGNYYTKPIAVINDAIANHTNVTFTFTSYAGYVGTTKSQINTQWVQTDQGYDYKTSDYDWHNPTFGQHLYTNVNNSYSLFDKDDYDMEGSYRDNENFSLAYGSTNWGFNLFTGAVVVNNDITMQLSDVDTFNWGNNSLTFDWFDITDDGRITDAKTFLKSMLLYTPVDWYWDTLTVVVTDEEREDIDAGAGLEDEPEVIEDEPEVEEPEIVEEPEVEETEAAPVETAPSPATGNAPVALAVIPVALAAAAVVAKKRG